MTAWKRIEVSTEVLSNFSLGEIRDNDDSIFCANTFRFSYSVNA